jgi:plasmid stabilization system protein ParE
MRGIIEHTGNRSIAAARGLKVRIDDATARLLDYPLLGRVVPEFEDPLIRELIVGSYRLMYRPDGDTIFVVTIIHGSRDLRRHLPDGPWDIQ